MADRGDSAGRVARDGLRARVIVPALATAALITGAVGTTSAMASGPTAPKATVASGSCSDPVVTDGYDGFRVGVPRGWNLQSTGGLITVAKDYTGQTNGFIQTAYVTRGQSVRGFFTKVLAYLAKITSTGSTTLAFHVTGGTTATATGRVGSVAVSGKASVRVIGVSANGHSELGIVSGYFAPTSQVGPERNELASIGGCYAPARGTLFRFFRDSQFAYVMPAGWGVIERSDLLFLHDGANASANYLFVGPLLESSSGVTDNQSLLSYSMKEAGVTVDKLLLTESGPTQIASNGGTEQEVFYYFLGHVGSKAIHGEARAISSVGSGAISGVVRFALTTPDLWNSLNGGLMWAALSIQHSFSGDLAQIQQAQEQQAGFAQQVAGFDQALNGTDLVEDPSTGAQYEAPYSDYQTGPDGPGYYVGSPGSEQKLTVLTR
ncbi:MAG TPA: hypothetical protein VG228_03780 [Solirubrobacteraceae bacterium]|jgi:hypothetical protein|nr:hypothetical protein [Solirubrobacteraceae bacterium]